MKIFFISFFVVFLPSLGNAQGLILISPDEVYQSNLAQESLMAKFVPDPLAPSIDVLSPHIVQDSILSAPFPIELRFRAIAPSSVKIDTFRVSYGSLGIDITDRLLKVAQLTEQGMVLKDANIPAGHHKLTISLGDTSGHLASKKLEFDVK